MKRRLRGSGGYFNARLNLDGRRLNRPGFTIVELLIVIVVIGILAAISIIAYNGVQVRATDSTTKSDASGAGKQLELAKAETGGYPDSIDSLSKSPGTTFAYTKTSEGFELTASADRKGTKTYCVSSSSLTPSEGKCVSHDSTAASCFTFDSSTGTITDYSDDSICPRDVAIPNEIEGTMVVAIGNFALENKKLTSVTIPGSVTSLGNYAFSYNQLTSVTIPDSVTNLGYHAFAWNQLTHFTIPESVTIIKNGAFRANQLTTIAIPNWVTSIGMSAFNGNQLTSVTFPNSVTSIGSSTFKNNLISSVIIPEAVKSVGDYTFEGNSGINCRIPDSATYNTFMWRCATIERY